ncbi:MAG TPA: hypothetical protein VE545_06295, partial [Candidatus Dormibacteraeota bacterium]|nr:hypothetical protein [Candidatus Dormibacteraeota bacterium]
MGILALGFWRSWRLVMVAGLKGIFFMFPKGFQVERRVIGIFGGVGAEAVKRGLGVVADLFQVGFLIVGETGAMEGENELEAEVGFRLAGGVE